MKYTFSHHITLSFLLIFLSVQSCLADPLTEVTNFLTQPNLMDNNPNKMAELHSPWGKLISKNKNTDDGWFFSTNTSPYLLEIVFAYDGKNWLFNDATVSFFANASNCTKHLNALKEQFIKKIGAPKAYNETEGFFWQLKNKEWGIWVSQIETTHPKTNESTCATKAVLAYGADEYLSEDNSF